MTIETRFELGQEVFAICWCQRTPPFEQQGDGVRLRSAGCELKVIGPLTVKRISLASGAAAPGAGRYMPILEVLYLCFGQREWHNQPIWVEQDDLFGSERDAAAECGRRMARLLDLRQACEAGSEKVGSGP